MLNLHSEALSTVATELRFTTTGSFAASAEEKEGWWNYASTALEASNIVAAKLREQSQHRLEASL